MRTRCICLNQRRQKTRKNISRRLVMLLPNRRIIVDGRNMPVLLADPEKSRGSDHGRRTLPDESRAEIVTPDATSGPAEWGRYHNAVREASRSFDNPGQGDIQQFLNARARNPERVDVPAFHEAVKRQRMADLVDIVDHHMRRDGSLPRGSRHIRVQAPKGYLRRALRNSTPEDVAHLHHRLTSIGHSKEHVEHFLSTRVAPDMWDQATTYEIHASEGEFDGLLFDDSDPEELEVQNLGFWSDDLMEALKEF